MERQRTVGELCREWREREGYTQEEISHRAFISVSQVSRFERGLTFSTAILYAYLELGCPITRRELIRYIGGKDAKKEKE